MKRFYLQPTSERFQGKPLLRIIYLKGVLDKNRQVKGGLVEAARNLRDNAIIENGAIVIGDSIIHEKAIIHDGSVIVNSTIGGSTFVRNSKIISSKLSGYACHINNSFLDKLLIDGVDIDINHSSFPFSGSINVTNVSIYGSTCTGFVTISGNSYKIINIKALSGRWNHAPFIMNSRVLGVVQEYENDMFHIFGTSAKLSVHKDKFRLFRKDNKQLYRDRVKILKYIETITSM